MTLNLLSNNPPLRPGQNVLLLHQGAGSTIDHFLRGPLEALGVCVEELDSAEQPGSLQLSRLLNADLVVVVRYLPRNWLKTLRQVCRAKIPMAYLMDDDLLDPDLLRELPVPYRRRIQERITRQRAWVPELCERVWVTSEVLALKYAHLGAVRLPLCPHPDLLTPHPRLQLAYLGSAVHQLEFAWLRELLIQLQQRQPHTHVDLFGDISVNRQFRDLPRVRVLHPMRWANYLAEIGRGRCDLLLTPLLESPINAARAPVKFIDAARCGAAGLYSDRPPYRGFVRHGIDGLLLGDHHQDWLAAIEMLVGDPQARHRLAEAGRCRALALSADLCPEGPAGLEGHGTMG